MTAFLYNYLKYMNLNISFYFGYNLHIFQKGKTKQEHIGNGLLWLQPILSTHECVRLRDTKPSYPLLGLKKVILY